MELVVGDLQVFSKDCIGCVRLERDIMITFRENQEKGTEFHDFFLTQEQAIALLIKLQSRIRENNKDE